jgi:hypothetical protein
VSPGAADWEVKLDWEESWDDEVDCDEGDEAFVWREWDDVEDNSWVGGCVGRSSWLCGAVVRGGEAVTDDGDDLGMTPTEANFLADSVAVGIAGGASNAGGGLPAEPAGSSPELGRAL